MFGGFWATAQDGFRSPRPGSSLGARYPGRAGYDFSDLAFVTTSDGVVAIDAGTAEDRVQAALGALDLPADGGD